MSRRRPADRFCSLLLLLGGLVLFAAAPFVVRAASLYDYDGDPASRVGLLPGAAASAPEQVVRELLASVGGARHGYDGPSQLARASASVVAYPSAPQTARSLNLPFRDAGLRSQVDDVVRHFDEVGTPPSGVAQGGLKGHPLGTYGNKSGALPQQPLGYYAESDVWMLGSGIKRGAELPDYYAPNWDAFDDCVGDLLRGDAGRVAVVVAGIDTLLRHDAHTFARSVHLLLGAVTDVERAAGAFQLEFVFVGDFAKDREPT